MKTIYLLVIGLLAVGSTLFGQFAVNGQAPFLGSGSTDLVFTQSLGGTQLGIVNVTNSGQRNYRLVTLNESGQRVEVGPSGCSGNVAVGALDGTVITGVRPCTEGNFRTNGSVRTYVFKTPKANQSNQFVFWRLTGPVREVTSVASSVSEGVSLPQQSVTVTARLGTVGQTASNKQTMYIRYSDDNFLSSYVVAMAANGDGTFTGNIPGEGLTAGETVRYYVFSSGSSITTGNNPAVTAANADLRTITFNNNGGSNYSFVVAAPLPVTYSSWAGTRVQDAVKLRWNTAAEKDADYFSIERSSNGGLEWQSTGEVPADNAAGGGEYAFMDRQAPSGQLQYRLRQVDFDGAYHYSSIIHIRSSATAPDQRIQIWPQPAPAATIQIRAAGRAGQTAHLITPEGKRVASFPLTGNAQPLPAVDLPKGIYFLRVDDGEAGTRTQRLMIE